MEEPSNNSMNRPNSVEAEILMTKPQHNSTLSRDPRFMRAR
jgi:hypothetical protein